MNYKRLLYFVHLPIFFFFTTSLCIADTYPAMLPATTAPRFPMQRYSEEGFAAGTLVRTPSGYQPIETITEHSIVLDDHAHPRRVLKVIRRIAQQCVRITIDNQTICMGYEQTVRLPYDTQWFAAGDIKKQEYLLNAHGHMLCVELCELIPEVTVLYQLSVEDHIFCVGSENLIVHNVDVATISTGLLCLEYVAYVHPLVALIGSTIALSTIAHQSYKAWQESRQSTDTDDDEALPQELFLAERYYYEQRKKELATLRDEFAGIYRGIVAIKELFHPNVTTFSSQFLPNTLQHHTSSNVLKISITDELKLSDDRKTALRNAREQEFALLEKEISELHALLVVHFNELIKQVYDAYDACIKYTTEVQNGIALWNNNKDVLTDSIASQSYEKEIMQECFLHNVQQKTVELKLIIAYYRKHKQLSSLQHSTNIVELLDCGEQFIKEIERWVYEQLTHVHSIMSVSEQYFARRTIPTALFKNQIKNAFLKDQNNKNAQSLKKAQDKVSSVNTGGPKKNDDEDDDNEPQDAQAPGMPTEKDGYKPPKNWDGKKVKNPNGSGSGWPDNKGNIWVPTGPGSKAHGGPHWDVQNPKTGHHRNIFPGGRER